MSEEALVLYAGASSFYAFFVLKTSIICNIQYNSNTVDKQEQKLYNHNDNEDTIKTTTQTAKKGKRTMKTNERVTVDEKATIDRIFERAFLHAISDGADEQDKEAARNLARALLEKEVPNNSPLLMLSTGFILGMKEGMLLAETMKG